jgi:hypothetical protein
MLCSARTSGIELELDDGRHVRIPVGAIELHPPPTVVRPSRGRLDAYVGSLVGSDTDLLVHDEVRERVLAIGDRVSIAGEMSEVDRAVAETSPFRGHMTSVWEPIGTPVLTVLD